MYREFDLESTKQLVKVLISWGRGHFPGDRSQSFVPSWSSRAI